MCVSQNVDTLHTQAGSRRVIDLHGTNDKVMCVCMHACMYACVYACMYACMYAYVCIWMCIHSQAPSKRAIVCVRIYVFVYRSTHAYMCI